jgi:hypothetical protein
VTEPYRELGGLSRPDAYFGAIEFDCPTCEAKGRTLESEGQKCRQWNDRTQRWDIKRCPCVARIKVAEKRSRLF